MVLRAGGSRAPRGLLQRVTVVSASLGKTLPGGSATALALTVRSLAAHGVDAASATAALAASGLLSSATLALLLPIGALLAVASGQTGGVALGGLAADRRRLRPAAIGHTSDGPGPLSCATGPALPARVCSSSPSAQRALIAPPPSAPDSAVFPSTSAATPATATTRAAAPAVRAPRPSPAHAPPRR